MRTGLLRTIGLTIENEVRLLVRDPIVALMLLVAPIVIITVAGFSLGNLYGAGSRVFVVPLLDADGGEIAREMAARLGHEGTLRLEPVGDVGEARAAIRRSDRAPLAIEIPAGTSAAIAAGRPAKLVLYVDAARRIEVNALELEIDRLCRRLAAESRERAQAKLDAAAAELEARLQALRTAFEQRRTKLRTEIESARSATAERLRGEISRLLERTAKEIEAVRRRQEAAWTELQSELEARAAIFARVERYLRDLQASERSFDDWIGELRKKAGRHADELPAPPAFPAPPSEADLERLARPIPTPALVGDLPLPVVPPALSTRVVPVPAIEDGVPDPAAFAAEPAQLPGVLDLEERPATEHGVVHVNAFDQYVPGFGVTFLLIGMMLGLSLALFDEREWGTFERLKASGAPLAGVLVGKVVARFCVGIAQMIVLFGVGRLAFGISLGREPLALLLPTIGMSFAAAALGLVVTAVAKSHDSVMPIGTMLSMALSAVGGCWWPLDFEPDWMQAVAHWLPTTWTMQAYNDLMIRRLPPSVVLEPFAATTALGGAILSIGIWALLREGGSRRAG